MNEICAPDEPIFLFIVCFIVYFLERISILAIQIAIVIPSVCLSVYPRQHLTCVTVIIHSSCVCSPTASRTSVVVISTRDDRRGQKAVVSYAKQVITA